MSGRSPRHRTAQNPPHAHPRRRQHASLPARGASPEVERRRDLARLRWPGQPCIAWGCIRRMVPRERFIAGRMNSPCWNAAGSLMRGRGLSGSALLCWSSLSLQLLRQCGSRRHDVLEASGIEWGRGGGIGQNTGQGQCQFVVKEPLLLNGRLSVGPDESFRELAEDSVHCAIVNVRVCAIQIGERLLNPPRDRFE